MSKGEYILLTVTVTLSVSLGENVAENLEKLRAFKSPRFCQKRSLGTFPPSGQLTKMKRCQKKVSFESILIKLNLMSKYNKSIRYKKFISCESLSLTKSDVKLVRIKVFA